MPTPARALDAPGVAAELARYRGTALVWLAAALVVGGVGVVLGLSLAGAKETLQRDGIPVPGVVTAFRPAEGRDEASVVVRYPGPTGSLEVAVAVPASGNPYTEGQTVMVLVDPFRPGRATLAGEPDWTQGEQAVVGLPVLAGAVLAAGGLAVVGRAARQRRVLASAPWRPSRLCYHEIHRGRYVARVLQVWDGEGEEARRARSSLYRVRELTDRRLRRSGLRGPVGPGAVVGHGRLALARRDDRVVVVSLGRPWTRWHERRWRAALAGGDRPASWFRSGRTVDPC